MRPNSDSSDPWESLRDDAERLLLANFQTTTLPAAPPFNSTNVTYSYPSPCQNATTVQESTSTLLSARAYAKAGLIKHAWLALDSLLSVQATNGMMPKYLFLPSNDTSFYFINHTNIPNWTLFQNYTNQQYQPPNTSLATRVGVRTSGRISAIPFHASLVLETFYLSNRTNSDLMQLQHYFDRLYRQHDFIHSVVMKGCHSRANNRSNNNNNNNNSTVTIPCYNVVHPWETLIPDKPHSSPIWNEALSQTNILMKHQSNWTPPVYNNPYHEDASLFLLECHSHAITSSHCNTSRECEDAMLHHCPFAMLDVGYTAALVQSNDDLLTMARILQDLKMHDSHLVNSETEQRLHSRQIRRQVQVWKRDLQSILENHLWNEQYQTYSSRYIVFEPIIDNSSSNTTLFIPSESKFLNHAVSDNFMALWTCTQNESRRDAMTFHLMQRQGNYSFDCGPYPLFSIGGCDNDDNDERNIATVSPVVNYLISRGLQHNNDTGLSAYLSNSTLNLVCGLPNEAIHPFSNDSTRQYCFSGIHFWNDYSGTTGLPLTTINPICGETLSAAAVYNFLVPDPPFDYIPSRPPPIRTSWVICIVVAELVMAFLIGVSCILLNLTLLRRVNDDVVTSGDALFGLIVRRDSGTDYNYFSAEASLEEVEEDEEDEEKVEGESA